MGDTYRRNCKKPCESLNASAHRRFITRCHWITAALWLIILIVSPDRIPAAIRSHGLSRTITEDLIGSLYEFLIPAIPDWPMRYISDIPTYFIIFYCRLRTVGIYDSGIMVATVHTGWRGAYSAIYRYHHRGMQRDFGTRFEKNFCYVFGTSIGPESFEVNQELANAFYRRVEENNWCQ